MADNKTQLEKLEELKKQHDELMEEFSVLSKESPELKEQFPDFSIPFEEYGVGSEDNELEPPEVPEASNAEPTETGGDDLPEGPEDVAPLEPPDVPGADEEFAQDNSSETVAAESVSGSDPLEPPDVPGEATTDEPPLVPDVSPGVDPLEPPDAPEHESQLTPGDRVWIRESGKRATRKRRLGKRVPPPSTQSSQPSDEWTDKTAKDLDLDDAEDIGIRDQTPDELRSGSDVAESLSDYSRALGDVLSSMQDILLDGIARFDQIEGRLRRGGM